MKGEDINMIGLMILPFGKNIFETLSYADNDRINGRFGMIGPIKNITATNPAVLTIPES